MARKKTKPSVEINVVPYIDVMLVLLIIFMITAPQLEQGVEVDLPQTENNSEVNLPEQESVFLVSIKEDESIYVSYLSKTEVVTANELKSVAHEFLNNNKDSKAFLRADKNIRYENVTNTIDILKSSGYPKVGLITKPTE